mmetsp:Transcript_13524/g.39483  ORF Transcript_13524/g.39483 Transcript_13524/m.39483 type:complete len:217 (+) Transcript_13524:357-1007(+)
MRERFLCAHNRAAVRATPVPPDRGHRRSRHAHGQVRLQLQVGQHYGVCLAQAVLHVHRQHLRVVEFLGHVGLHAVHDLAAGPQLLDVVKSIREAGLRGLDLTGGPVQHALRALQRAGRALDKLPRLGVLVVELFHAVLQLAHVHAQLPLVVAQPQGVGLDLIQELLGAAQPLARVAEALVLDLDLAVGLRQALGQTADREVEALDVLLGLLCIATK